jgi:ABC-type dipeptide/oligopeptide/nickel transport system permease subunit
VPVLSSDGAQIGTVYRVLDNAREHIFDGIVMRIMDGLEAFPSILLALTIMATLGPATENVIIALSVVYTPNIARLVRGTTLMNRQQTYVESARAIGMRDFPIMRRYIFANSLSPLIVQGTFVVAFAILSEASLSFLGAGVPPRTPTWGSIVSDGQPRLQQAWWISVFAGTFLAEVVADDFDPTAAARLDTDWSYRFLRSRANSIEGGTSEIQRNIMGERVLGLPGEPRVDKDMPWTQVPRS